MRYFFDVHDGQLLRDEEGIECDDLTTARREALKAAGEMLRDKSRCWTGEPWSMKVRVDSGTVVSTLSFSAH